MSAPLPPGINAGAPAAPAPAGGGGAPVPLGDVLIRALPDRLSGLDRAVSISGTVVAQEDGAATIRTAAGDVTVETPAPLPTDRPVTLRIPPQVPGAPSRAQASAPPAPQAPTPATEGPQTAVAPAPTASLTPPPLPSIQTGATIIAMVVAALQPRPPAPPAPGTPGSTDGDDVPAGPSVADDGATGSAPAPGPARPATSPPASSTLPATSPPGGGQPAGGPDPLTILLGGSGGDDSASTAPVAGATSRPSPSAEAKTSPADGGEPARPATPPRPADPAADAVRLARLARYNIATEAPSSGLLSLQEFGSKPASAPLTEARLRGGSPPAPPTAPPTTPSASSAPTTAPPLPPRPAPSPPAAAPPVPAGAAPPAVDPDALIMARLRGGSPPSPPTAAPTVPTPPPAPGPSSPQIVPADMPVEVARLRGTAPQGGEPTAPPTGPTAPPTTNPSHPGKPPAAAGPSPEPAMQLTRLREGQTVSPPPTAPPTIPTPGSPTPQPTVPQQTPPLVPATDAPVILARLREGAPPAPPSAPPTVGTPSVEPKTPPVAPPVPHRQGTMSAALAAQEAAPATQLARLRETTPPAPTTAPPTSPAAAPPPRGAVPPATTPATSAPANPLPTRGDGVHSPAVPSPSPAATGPTSPAGQDGRPQQPSVSSPASTVPASPDDALQQARLRDGRPPAPATAPATIQAPAAPGPRPAVPAPRQQPDSPAQFAQMDAGEPSAEARGMAGQPASRAPADALPAGPIPDRPTLPHGQPVRLRILALDAAPGNSSSPQTVTGTLVGSTAQGQPVVTTPLGTLVLRARTDLPAGTTLALAVDIPPTPKAAMLPPLDPAQGLDWPVLREVMATLAAADPVLARTIAASILPQPNKRLTTNLTFFLSALRGGDATGWLGGPAAELLEARGGSRLLAQLREDFRAAQQAAAEPTADGWRAMPIPFGTPEQLMRAQLHVKNAGDQDKDDRTDGEKQGPAKRFLLDLSFSRIGPMQFDGMVRPGRFDLMVRTQNLLPAEVRQQIGTIFRDSLETVGYSGSIAFQTGAHQWARVQSSPRGPGVRA